MLLIGYYLISKYSYFTKIFLFLTYYLWYLSKILHKWLHFALKLLLQTIIQTWYLNTTQWFDVIFSACYLVLFIYLLTWMYKFMFNYFCDLREYLKFIRENKASWKGHTCGLQWINSLIVNKGIYPLGICLLRREDGHHPPLL